MNMKTSCLFLVLILMVSSSESHKVNSDNKRQWVVRAKPGLLVEEADRDKLVDKLSSNYHFHTRKIGSLYEWFEIEEDEQSDSAETDKMIDKLMKDNDVSEVRLEVGKRREKKPKNY